MINFLKKFLYNPYLSEYYKRNSVLDLAEIQEINLYKNIISILEEDKSDEYTSLLVYALTFYPAEPLMEKAIDWLISGNFEVAHSAFYILNNIKEINGEQVDNAFNKLIKSIENAKNEEWRIILIEDILSMFY